MSTPRTIVDKIWSDHVVSQDPGAPVETPEARRKRLKLAADEQADTLKLIESE